MGKRYPKFKPGDLVTVNSNIFEMAGKIGVIVKNAVDKQIWQIFFGDEMYYYHSYWLKRIWSAKK